MGFPRVAAGFDFHRPLRFEDEFDISIRIVAIEQKTIRYTCLLTRGEERIATGTLTIICVSKRAGEAMKAMAIPPEIAARFEVASRLADDVGHPEGEEEETGKQHEDPALDPDAWR